MSRCLVPLLLVTLGGCSDRAGVAAGPGESSASAADSTVASGEALPLPRAPELSRALRAIQVAAGNYNACARFEQGVVACWGRCTMACETLSHETSGSIEPIAVRDAVDVAVGDSFACAVTRAGSVVCWGYNASGALAVRGVESTKVPRAIPSVSHAVEVAASERMACARSANGDVYVWGGANAALPRRVPALSGATALVGDAQRCCVRREGGYACIRDVDEEPTVTPFRPGPCGCELSDKAELRCEMRARPASPALRGEGYQAPLLACSLASLGDVRDFAIAGEAGYALRASGEIWRWGAVGRLGERAPLEAVAGLPPVQSLASGALGAVFAVDDAGSIWAWGPSSEHAISASDELVATPRRIWAPTR